MASIDTINGPKMGPEVFSGCFRLLSSPWVQIHVRGKQIAMHNFFWDTLYKNIEDKEAPQMYWRYWCLQPIVKLSTLYNSGEILVLSCY